MTMMEAAESSIASSELCTEFRSPESNNPTSSSRKILTSWDFKASEIGLMKESQLSALVKLNIMSQCRLEATGDISGEIQASLSGNWLLNIYGVGLKWIDNFGLCEWLDFLGTGTSNSDDNGIYVDFVNGSSVFIAWVSRLNIIVPCRVWIEI